jgi:hypothetical protein
MYDMGLGEHEAYNVGFLTFRLMLQWSSSLLIFGGGLKALVVITTRCRIYIRTST